MNNTLIISLRTAFLAILISLMSTLPARADRDRAISESDLPETALAFVREHFPGVPTAYVMQERDMLSVSYEIMLTNGVKIEFDRKGNWKEIECRYGCLPPELVPPQALHDIQRMFPGTQVREVSRDKEISRRKKGWEIKLSNGIDLIYAKGFRLIEIDD